MAIDTPVDEEKSPILSKQDMDTHLFAPHLRKQRISFSVIVVSVTAAALMLILGELLLSKSRVCSSFDRPDDALIAGAYSFEDGLDSSEGVLMTARCSCDLGILRWNIAPPPGWDIPGSKRSVWPSIRKAAENGGVYCVNDSLEAYNKRTKIELPSNAVVEEHALCKQFLTLSDAAEYATHHYMLDKGAVAPFFPEENCVCLNERQVRYDGENKVFEGVGQVCYIPPGKILEEKGVLCKQFSTLSELQEYETSHYMLAETGLVSFLVQDTCECVDGGRNALYNGNEVYEAIGQLCYPSSLDEHNDGDGED